MRDYNTRKACVHNVSQPGPFNWDMKMQGFALGAFFYGYITTQVLGGTLAQRIGGKIPFLCGVACTAALTLLLPILTTVGGLPALFVLRFLMGMFEVRIGQRHGYASETCI